jgi:hypothetical protein
MLADRLSVGHGERERNHPCEQQKRPARKSRLTVLAWLMINLGLRTSLSADEVKLRLLFVAERIVEVV